MIIETEILFIDESQSNILGHDIKKTAPFIFNLFDVSGIMPGDDENKTSIIFLSGTDLIINLPFSSLSKKYKEIKKMIISNER